MNVSGASVVVPNFAIKVEITLGKVGHLQLRHTLLESLVKCKKYFLLQCLVEIFVAQNMKRNSFFF